jgi:hypothetical protein
VIDAWACKVDGVARRPGVSVVQIEKSRWCQKVGGADHRRAANEPIRTREVLRRAGLIDDAAIDKRRTDQSIQPGAGLRKGRTTSNLDVASTEGVTKERNQVDFLQETRLLGAYIGRAAKGHRGRVRDRGDVPNCGMMEFVLVEVAPR